MKVTLEIAEYIHAVARALTDGRKFRQMTNVCPECGDRVDLSNDAGDHVVFDTDPNDRDGLVIIIACEGYWVIDPREVGISGHDNWMSVDAQVMILDGATIVADLPSGRLTTQPNKFGVDTPEWTI
jgi:hypothetical protein